MTAAAAITSTTTVSSGEFSPPSWILLNVYAKVGKNINETTTHFQVSNDVKIYASLVRERPPLTSNLYLYCLGDSFAEPPFSLSMVDDLILFHVCIGPPTRSGSELPSYIFIYRADPKRPSLDLVSHASTDHPFGIFPRGEDHYTIASLAPLEPVGHLLSLYDSMTKTWTCKKLCVESPQEDFPVPIPVKFYRMFSHHTSAVLTFGESVGWVDLWRGIVACDMLSEKHTLSGIPLPLPFKCIEGDIDLGSVRTHRGISFIDGHLRLVEVGFKGGIDVPNVFHEETGWPSSRIQNWTITIWTNKEMGNSYDDWHINCTLQASEIFLGDHPEAQLPPIALQNLFVSDPIIGMDENDRHVVYLTARERFLHRNSWILAIDTRNRKVQSVVVRPTPLSDELWVIDAPYYASSISK